MAQDFSFLPRDKENFTRCFACGKDNPIGLKLSFEWDGQFVRTEFTPTEPYQGWPGLAHGAIVMALLDEAMSWAAFYSGFCTVTGKLNAKLQKPARIGEPLSITGHITRATRKLLETEASVTLHNGERVAWGEGTMFILDKNHFFKEKSS